MNRLLTREWLDERLHHETFVALPTYYRAYKKGYNRGRLGLSLSNSGYSSKLLQDAWMLGIKEGHERAKKERLIDLLGRIR